MMRACNNNSMRNPTEGYVCYYYCMPSSLAVLLHIYLVKQVIIVACPHPLCRCIYTALISVLSSLHPSTFVLHLFHLFFVVYLLANTMLFAHDNDNNDDDEEAASTETQQKSFPYDTRMRLSGNLWAGVTDFGSLPNDRLYPHRRLLTTRLRFLVKSYRDRALVTGS